MKYKLSDICETVTDYVANGSFKSLAENVQYLDTKDYARLIRLVDFGNDYDDKNAVWVSKKSYDFLKKTKLFGNEIIISNVGANLGTVFLCPKLNYAMTLGPNCIVLKTNGSICDQNYLYYYLLSGYGHAKIMSIVSGSAMPKFNKTDLRNLELEIPNLKTQQRTVRILSAIDQKIKVIDRENHIIENILQNHFDNWVSNMKPIDEVGLDKIAKYTNGLAMQKYRPEDNDSGLPVIKIKEMNSGISKDTERCTSELKEDFKIFPGDVLFAWSGTLCMKIWDGEVAGLNQHIFKVTSEEYPKWFYYFWTKKHLARFINIAKSKATTMGHIQRKELSASKVLVPNKFELEKQDEFFEPLFKKIISNNSQRQSLLHLHDTLIPKLISGEINLENMSE